MPTTFRHPKRKIALAREHIKALQAAETAFRASEPYTRVIEPNANGLKKVHKVRVVKDLPDTVFNHVDQAVSALRSALDKACYSTTTVIDSKRCAFPIADTFEMLMTDVIGRGHCRDLAPEILAHILSLEPYKRIENRGNDFIWAVNRLANTDKHRNVEIYGISTQMTDYKRVTWTSDVPVEIEWGSYWDRSKKELIILTVDNGVNLNYEIAVSFCIAFAEIEGLGGLPAASFLASAADEIEGIIFGIESEAIRLGLTT